MRTPSATAAESTSAGTSTDAPLRLPLGPDSLTWRMFGDVRGLLLVTRVGVLQAMHPAIGAALVQQSDFFQNPWNRLLRSMGPILGVVYDPAADGTATTVRDFHRDIKGTGSDGRRYRALDPETYYWAHATFFEGQIALRRVLGQPLDEAECHRLYAESVTWYRRYGLSMRPVPRDYDGFRDYWERMLDEVLEPTEAARWAFELHELPAPIPWLRGPAWWALRGVIDGSSTWIARGTLPPRAREILGLTWAPHEEAALRALALASRPAWRAVPEPLRYLPRARAGLRAARAAA